MYPQLTSEIQENEIKMVMDTTMGAITFKLFPEQAPKTVENFVTLAKKGYYDDIIFHRIIENFMIQGGDPTGTGMGGESAWGGNFEDEFHQELFNFRGALSMANAGPNTNGSQFFIVQAKAVDNGIIKQCEVRGWPKDALKSYKQLGGTPWLDGKHTVFGQVIDGMDVVDAMAKVEKGFQDKPKETISIKSVTIED